MSERSESNGSPSLNRSLLPAFTFLRPETLKPEFVPSMWEAHVLESLA